MRNRSANAAAEKATLIAWKPWYSVGHDELDGHHQAIIAMVNDLYAGLQEGTEEASTKDVLDRLVDYTKWHFSREEELMRACQFPGLADHRAAHRRLVKDLNHLRFKNLRREELSSSELLEFLKRWWLDHIGNVDKQYSAYLTGAASRA